MARPKDLAKTEYNRLKRILKRSEISPDRMEALQPIVENVAWMLAKLDDARRLIKDQSIVTPYDNGGGQKGMRENPAFRGYEALWKAYMAGMAKILDALPPEAVEDEKKRGRKEEPKTVLSLIRDKHGKSA